MHAAGAGAHNEQPWPDVLLSEDELRPLVVNTLQAGVRSFAATQPDHAGELKLTVLTHCATGQPTVCAHVAPLPPRPEPPVKIQVRLPPVCVSTNNTATLLPTHVTIMSHSMP